MAEYTEEQLAELLQKEGDRRVTAALATNKTKLEQEFEEKLAAQKSQWEKDFTERAKLSAEELAQKEFEQKLAEIAEREKTLRKQSNDILAKQMFTEKGYTADQYEKMLGVLVADNEDATKANIESYMAVLEATRTATESKVRTELTKIPPPPTGDSHGGTVSKQDFDKMSYTQKVEFKISNPEEYKTFTNT